MNIFQLNQILLEYNNIGSLTTLVANGGDKTSGKSLDNIAAGVTNPYKQQVTKQPTEIEKRFPNLAKVINQVKKDSIKGDKIVIGAALNELRLLTQTMNLKTNENGQTTLPFGNNIRLIQKGNNFFIRLNSSSQEEKQTQQLNLTGQQVPII